MGDIVKVIRTKEELRERIELTDAGRIYGVTIPVIIKYIRSRDSQKTKEKIEITAIDGLIREVVIDDRIKEIAELVKEDDQKGS